MADTALRRCACCLRVDGEANELVGRALPAFRSSW
jgi:hypothetical protein